MKQYVKKPIPVSALQWTGKNTDEIKVFCTDSEGYVKCFTNAEHLWIHTREGQLKAVVGDYIMRGIEGEFYPCGEQIFNKTYNEFNELEFVFPSNENANKNNITRVQIKEKYFTDDIPVLMGSDFNYDSAILGIDLKRKKACYSISKMIEIFMDNDTSKEFDFAVSNVRAIVKDFSDDYTFVDDIF